MRSLPHRTGAVAFSIVAAFAGAFLLVHLLAPRWAHTAGLDFWEMDRAVEHLRSEERRTREIQVESDRVFCQVSVCDDLATALIDERISFADAVDRIDEITQDRQGFAEVLMAIHPQARTHRERLARYTIAKVQSILTDDPSRQVEVLDRLEVEYQKMVSSR